MTADDTVAFEPCVCHKSFAPVTPTHAVHVLIRAPPLAGSTLVCYAWWYRDRTVTHTLEDTMTTNIQPNATVSDVREALAEWETLVEGATEGPWEAVGDGDPYLRRGDVATRGEPGNRFIVCEHAGPDAEFIAAARTAMPALLGFVREALEGHEAEAEARAFDPVCCARCREEWPCPTEQAARKWIGGEG